MKYQLSYGYLSYLSYIGYVRISIAYDTCLIEKPIPM